MLSTWELHWVTAREIFQRRRDCRKFTSSKTRLNNVSIFAMNISHFLPNWKNYNSKGTSLPISQPRSIHWVGIRNLSCYFSHKSFIMKSLKCTRTLEMHTILWGWTKSASTITKKPSDWIQNWMRRCITWQDAFSVRATTSMLIFGFLRPWK